MKTISIVEYLYSMSISRQNLSIVIVTFKSEGVIHQCIQSIDKDIQIIVIENSNNKKFKDEIEKKYLNVRCHLSKDNLGMGAGNNLGIEHVKTDYILILNPDVILEGLTINEMILAANKISSFAILSPISSNKNYPNYQLCENKKYSFQNTEAFEVRSVDGFAMLLDIKKIELTIDKKDTTFFDENFFMYLENDDLCKRIIDKNEKIYIIPTAKINHLGGKAVNEKYNEEVELSRNWHWMWSKFYFNKKHHSFLIAMTKGFPSYFSAILKYLFYLVSNNKFKKKIYFNRASGYFNALINSSSWYRPKIKD
jgi:N-acetylglucosaminyl-diphospho-decaprenol L-rhamnosyltransferase